MCGIFGVGFFTGHKLAGKEAIVKEMIAKVFVNSEVRGRDASGIMCSTKTGTIDVVKKDMRSSYLSNTELYKKVIDETVDLKENKIWSVIGHCRAKTKGSELNNTNNHPIVRQDVVGVHNGSIQNDDSLFRENSDIKRNGQVDSEIIFALIEKYVREAPHGEKIHTSIIKTMKETTGAVACSMVHKKHPHIIWLFRKYNPCDVLVFDDVGMVIFASEKGFINRAVDGYDFGESKALDFPTNSGLSIDLHRNRYFDYKL